MILHKKNFLFRFILLIFVFLVAFLKVYSYTPLEQTRHQSSKDIIVIHEPHKDKAAKEALLILPGFGDKRRTRKIQKCFFSQYPYDLYIPDYHDRKSYRQTIENLQQFYEQQELDKYQKVHVFVYILGSWVINEFIQQEGRKNIHTIIYNRSPLQERAPRVVVDKIPRLAKLSKGQLLFDFKEAPYLPMTNDSIKVGIIIENKATKLIKLFKKTALSYGPVSWTAAGKQQQHDDLMHVYLDHNEMYRKFDVIGADIIYFLENGRFTSSAKRERYELDAF